MKPNQKIADRIKREIERLPDVEPSEGVQSLNPGFFLVQRIRDNTSPKQRAVVRADMKEMK